MSINSKFNSIRFKIGDKAILDGNECVVTIKWQTKNRTYSDVRYADGSVWSVMTDRLSPYKVEHVNNILVS